MNAISEVKPATHASIATALPAAYRMGLEAGAKVAFDGLSLEWVDVDRWTDGYEAARQDIDKEIRALPVPTPADILAQIAAQEAEPAPMTPVIARGVHEI